MDSTFIRGLELLILEGTGGKAQATDHRSIHTDTTFLSCLRESVILNY